VRPFVRLAHRSGGRAYTISLSAGRDSRARLARTRRGSGR
jgi:hypothetical protein